MQPVPSSVTKFRCCKISNEADPWRSMHSLPPSRKWAASSRSQHRRSTRCLPWCRSAAGKLDSTATTSARLMGATNGQITDSIELQKRQASCRSNPPRPRKRGEDSDRGRGVLPPVEAGGRQPSTVLVDQLWHHAGDGNCVRRGGCQHLL